MNLLPAYLRHLLSFSLLVLVLFVSACRQEAGAPQPVKTQLVKIQVAADGPYRVPLAALQEAGLAVESMTADTLHLSQAGEAVPYFIDNNSLIFYGLAPDSRYTAVRSYFLEAGRPGLTMTQTAVKPAAAPPLTQVPQSIHLEHNQLYLAQAYGKAEGDLWFWDTLSQGKKLTLSFNIPAVADGSGVLRLRLWGATYNPAVDNDHDFDLILNDQRIETIRWDGETGFTSQTILPAGSLQVGTNTIVLDNEVEGASFVDIMQLDWAELSYQAPPQAVNDRLEISQVAGPLTLSGFTGTPILLDTTQPTAPTLLTGWQCQSGQACLDLPPDRRLVAVGPAGFSRPAAIEQVRTGPWRSPATQAELLIITTDELADALTPLIAARKAAGLAVALVTVEEIYDDFGYGEASPESIRAFVRYAFETWADPKPRYLFLVGEATTDYRNYLNQAPQNVVPVPMVEAVFSGETVSDSRLADVDRDMMPDLAVGRWPVESVQAVQSLVARTLAYEEAAAVGGAIFAADGTEPQFAAVAAELAELAGLPADQVTLLNGPSAGQVADRWNEGAWLVTYIGHGSVERWGKENVFDLTAVSRLRSTPPPIVLQLTCLTGLFALPGTTSLSEAMLAHDRGPVLLVAATSLTFSADQEPFGASLLQQLQDPGTLRMGDAFLAAKRSLDVSGSSGFREVSDTFTLFGDPSTLIVRPKP